MKNLLFVAMTVMALAFVSCGNGNAVKNDSDTAVVDTNTVVADTVVVDSVSE